MQQEPTSPVRVGNRDPKRGPERHGLASWKELASWRQSLVCT